MSISCKIDLTVEDHTLKHLKQYTNNEEKGTAPSENSSESLFDTLRSIQEGNPNIETVFLEESDEEGGYVVEETTTTKLSNFQNILDQISPEPAQNVPVLPSPSVTLNTTIPSSNVTQSSSNNTKQSPILSSMLPCINQTQTPLRVREVPPSNLTANLMKNSNTIVLDNPNSLAKQILVIPNDVLPLIASSKHPISLNVPGVGYVVINKPESLTPVPVPVKKKPEPIYDPLCDPKYHCWKYRKIIKRDLEGYSINDRLGFYQAEQRRSNMCLLYYENSIKKKMSEIEEIETKLGLKQLQSDLKKDKLGEIDKTKKRLKKEKDLTPRQKKNLRTINSWKEHFEKKSSSEDDELLLTKKVLHNKKNNKKIKKKTFKHKNSNKNLKSSKENPYSKKYNSYFKVKPCRIIDNLNEFQEEVNPSKSVLVINENNLNINFEKLCRTNNLVYTALNDSNIPKLILNNAMMYNILCVKPDILKKYLKGKRE